MSDPTLELAQELIARPSVTPDDRGCQELLIARLAPLGFQVQRLPFGNVTNLWAWRGDQKPLLVFAGHTDVVPPGPRESWSSDPFTPTIRDGLLYGRGAADMKSSIAAFITAIEDFIRQHPRHRGTIGILITSDEEGPSVDGTVKVMDWLRQQNIQIAYCIVGEPTSTKQLGDVIKNGRRGSLNGKLRVNGIQGHVAYPQFARNPVHMLAPAVAELVATEWDQGTADFPKTTFQISGMRAGTGADNVIPGKLEVDFNFRFSSAVTEGGLCARVEQILKRHKVDYELRWTLSGQPYLTKSPTLIGAAQRAIRTVVGVDPELSTDGGTSDGRFIAPSGAEVIEIGPLNSTVHKANESVAVADLAVLARVYGAILLDLLS